ncbi:hypothetical protein HY993_02045 [Candidatus Micrarchaeota archaeon]|nr:hypothetical protein [Candidatus Micrarchaeota archaeon]
MMGEKTVFALAFALVVASGAGALLGDYNYLLEENKVGENNWFYGYECNAWQDLSLPAIGVSPDYWDAYTSLIKSKSYFDYAKGWSGSQRRTWKYTSPGAWLIYGERCKQDEAAAVNNAIEAGKKAVAATSAKQLALFESIAPGYSGNSRGLLDSIAQEERQIKEGLPLSNLSAKFLNASNATRLAKSDFAIDENIFQALKSVGGDGGLFAQLIRQGERIGNAAGQIREENYEIALDYFEREADASRRQSVLDSYEVGLIDESSLSLLTLRPKRLVGGSTASLQELYYEHYYALGGAKDLAKGAQNKLNSNDKDATTGSTREYSLALKKLSGAEKIFSDLSVRASEFVNELENHTIAKILSLQERIQKTAGENPSAAADANEYVNGAIGFYYSSNADSFGKKSQKLRSALLLLDKAEKRLEQNIDVEDAASRAGVQVNITVKLIEEAKRNGFSEEIIALESQLGELRELLAKTSVVNENKRVFDGIYFKAIEIADGVKALMRSYDDRISELVKKLSSMQGVLTAGEQETLLNAISSSAGVGGKKAALDALNAVYSRILSQSKQLIAGELSANTAVTLVPQKTVLGQAAQVERNYWTKNALPLEYSGEISFNAKLSPGEELAGKSGNIARINPLTGLATALGSSEGEEYSFATKQTAVIAVKTGDSISATGIGGKAVVRASVSFDSAYDWPVAFSISLPKSAAIKSMSSVLELSRGGDSLFVTVAAKKGKNDFFIEYELPVAISEEVFESNGQTRIELTVISPVDLDSFEAAYLLETPFAQEKVQSNGFFQTQVQQQGNAASVTLSASGLKAGLEYKQTILAKGLAPNKVILLTNSSLNEPAVLDPDYYDWQLTAGLQKELESLSRQENLTDLAGQLKKSLGLMQANELEAAKKELAGAEKTAGLILASKIEELKSLAKQTSDPAASLSYANCVEADATQKALNNKYVDAFNAVDAAKAVLEAKILEYEKQTGVKQITITNVTESKGFIQGQLEDYQKAFSGSDAQTTAQVLQQIRQVSDLVKEFEKPSISSLDPSVVAAKKDELNKGINQINAQTQAVKQKAAAALNATRQKVDALGGFSDLRDFEDARKLFDGGQYTQAIKKAQEISDRLEPKPTISITGNAVVADNMQVYLGAAGGIILLTLGAVFLRKKHENGFDQV